MSTGSGTAEFRAPNRIEALFNQAMGFLAGLGVGPKFIYLLQVRGRKTGRIYSTPVNLMEVGGKQNLRERLKREAMLNAERDLAIAAEWFPIEEEAEVVASALPLRRKSKNAEQA